jgi:hypothetical protein
MTNNAPIVLFVYNRVTELKKTVKFLQANFMADQSELYIFSDGSKNKIDFEKVQGVREYIKTITGFSNIYIIENEGNKGLANSIIDGVTEVIKKHGKVIVLEDDLITSPNFLDFMNQALVFYKNDPEILSLSGYTLDLPSLPGNKDYYFGYRASSWGWGCWLDRWEKIDWEVEDYEEFIKIKSLQNKFNRGGSDMTKMLKRQQRGEIDSWAIRFCYHQFKEDLKTVFPTQSKIESIGFSNEATHTAGTKRFVTPLDEGDKRKFSFEKFDGLDKTLVYEFKDKFSIKARLFDKIHKFLKL